MTNDYPFHRHYVRALTTGNIPALRKLIRRALRAKPQKKYFTTDGTRKPLTPFEELVTSVWRTIESVHIEHCRLFLKAGLSPNLLMPDVEGMNHGIYFTPLELAVFGNEDIDQARQAEMVEMLIAAGGDYRREIYPGYGLLGNPHLETITGWVRSVDVARVFMTRGVPVKAFDMLRRSNVDGFDRLRNPD